MAHGGNVENLMVIRLFGFWIIIRNFWPAATKFVSHAGKNVSRKPGVNLA